MQYFHDFSKKISTVYGTCRMEYILLKILVAVTVNIFSTLTTDKVVDLFVPESLTAKYYPRLLNRS